MQFEIEIPKPMSDTIRHPHSWTRMEYDRMVEAGVFPPDSRLELIEGEIVDMTPQGSGHVTAVHLIAEVLRNVFGVPGRVGQLLSQPPHRSVRDQFGHTVLR